MIHPGEVIDAEEAAVPPGVRESSAGRLTTAGSWLFVLALAVFFLFPFYAIARFAFQRVPTALLGANNLFDEWTFSGLTTAFRDPSSRRRCGSRRSSWWGPWPSPSV